jgi:hypothetical protein
MRGRFLAMGISLTFLCWIIGALFAFGQLAGDCFPDLNHVCPSDFQRERGVLEVALVVACINIVGLLVIGYREIGRRDDR